MASLYGAPSPHRHTGSGGGNRPYAPSPNSTTKRDPSTPSRVVRKTKTPPTSGLTMLPPVGPTSPPRDDDVPIKSTWAGSAIDESIDDVSRRSPSPIPSQTVKASTTSASSRHTNGKQDSHYTPTSSALSVNPSDLEYNDSMTRPGRERRSSSVTPYDDDDFESSSDSDLQSSPDQSPPPSRPTATPSQVAESNEALQTQKSPSPAGQEQQDQSANNGSSDSGVATGVTVKRSSPSPSNTDAPATVQWTKPPAKESSKTDEAKKEKRKPTIQVNLGAKQLIGAGSYGNVYRAVDVLTNRLVAVKEILLVEDELRDLKKQIHAVEREIRVMQKLDHPNIVKYLGAKRQGTALYLYMEFVPGGTISSFISNFGKLSEPQAARFTVQMLSGLDYLHSKQIAHRDLKGENLFVDTLGGLKLGDFGTSKELRTLRVTKTVAGTPYFMAPEVINCSGHGLEADIWSVGCVVIQMLTGHPPFHDCDNAFAVMFQVSKGEMGNKIPSEVSAEAKDFILCCVKMDPKQRWTTQQLLAHPWLRGIDSGVPENGGEHVAQSAGGNATPPPASAPTSAEGNGDATKVMSPDVGRDSGGSVGRLRSKMPSSNSPPPEAEMKPKTPPPGPSTPPTVAARGKPAATIGRGSSSNLRSGGVNSSSLPRGSATPTQSQSATGPGRKTPPPQGGTTRIGTENGTAARRTSGLRK